MTDESMSVVRLETGSDTEPALLENSFHTNPLRPIVIDSLRVRPPGDAGCCVSCQTSHLLRTQSQCCASTQKKRTKTTWRMTQGHRRVPPPSPAWSVDVPECVDAPTGPAGRGRREGSMTVKRGDGEAQCCSGNRSPRCKIGKTCRCFQRRRPHVPLSTPVHPGAP